MGTSLAGVRGAAFGPAALTGVQAARILDNRGNIELAEVHRRVLEFRRLLEDQRQLIEELDQRGYDATSAQIIFESSGHKLFTVRAGAEAKCCLRRIEITGLSLYGRWIDQMPKMGGNIGEIVEHCIRDRPLNGSRRCLRL